MDVIGCLPYLLILMLLVDVFIPPIVPRNAINAVIVGAFIERRQLECLLPSYNATDQVTAAN